MKTTQTKPEVSKYDTQANEFLALTKTTFKAEFLKYDHHFEGDKEKRDIYKITLLRGTRKMEFNFGQSIAHSGKYIGHKHLCLNEFGKYLFTEEEYKKLPYYAKQKQHNDVKLNPKFEVPTAYSILACLTKCDPGTLKNFCNEFGCSEDSKTAEKTYMAVVTEWEQIKMLFSDEEIELLQEIQ